MEARRAGVPAGARAAARVLVISEDAHLLLLEGRNEGGPRWWVAPGGGLQDEEGFADAAARELLEETGFSVPIGPCVWTRHHRYDWYGSRHDQFERFFVARGVPRADPEPLRRDGYIVGHRWWSLEEIAASDHSFAPRRLARVLPAILDGRYPEPPVDVGV